MDDGQIGGSEIAFSQHIGLLEALIIATSDERGRTTVLKVSSESIIEITRIAFRTNVVSGWNCYILNCHCQSIIQITSIHKQRSYPRILRLWISLLGNLSLNSCFRLRLLDQVDILQFVVKAITNDNHSIQRVALICVWRILHASKKALSLVKKKTHIVEILRSSVSSDLESSRDSYSLINNMLLLLGERSVIVAPVKNEPSDNGEIGRDIRMGIGL